MTLNVSLRVPDGIVLASDSLATLMQMVNQKMNVQATCASCGAKMELKGCSSPSNEHSQLDLAVCSKDVPHSKAFRVGHVWIWIRQ